jgi:hypothetical protein
MLAPNVHERRPSTFAPSLLTSETWMDFLTSGAMMKIKPLLLGAGLFLAASGACAKLHDHGDVGAKGAHGLHGSFADGVLGNGHRKHGAPPFDLDVTSNFEAGARDLGDHDFRLASDTTRDIQSALSHPTVPVPEPHTYVLILAGLGAAGLLVLRRKVDR